jgi:hypothetical protein
MTSPTQRSLTYLKKQGLKTGIVERWLPNPAYPGGGKRSDLFSIIDIIAIDDARTIGCQSCGTAFSQHHKKLFEEKAEEVRDWLAGGTRQLWLIGWRKLLKKRGGKLKLWRPRIRVYFLSEENYIDFKDVE